MISFFIFFGEEVVVVGDLSGRICLSLSFVLFSTTQYRPSIYYSLVLRVIMCGTRVGEG